MKPILLGLIILLILLLVILAIGLTVKPNNNHKNKSVVRGLLIAIVTFLSVFVVLLIGAFTAIYTVHQIERSQLFHPTKLHRYQHFLHNGSSSTNRWFTLPHGGGLLQVSVNNLGRRKVLFLHGNTGSLDLYAKPLITFAQEMGYDIYALEYRGYGITDHTFHPSASSVIIDALDAWKLIGNENTIVCGFSLGGALLGEIYERLVPQPAQLVFLNTFWSFSDLVQEKLGSKLSNFLNPLLETQWLTKAPTKFKGKVVVVFTADDSVVPQIHGKRLCQIFYNTDLNCIMLPNAGHKVAPFVHINEWKQYLLSPQL